MELLQPRSLAEALALLDPADPDVRPISGGTALMLMMKSGVFAPRRLVSLARVEPEHSAIAVLPDGTLRIGAMATLTAIGASAGIRAGWPSIAATLRRLSNVRVRNVACIGGHLAHGDPHMDLPPLLAALGASVEVLGPAGARSLKVAELHRGYYETALAPGELITAVIVPPMDGAGAIYVKVTARAADDWPALGIAARLRLEGGLVRDADLFCSAATVVPTRLAAAEAALRGAAPAGAAITAAAEAARAEVEPLSDAHGSAAYKRELLAVHLGRAIAAVARGLEGGKAS